MSDTTTLGVVAFGLQFGILLTLISMLKCRVRNIEKSIEKGCTHCNRSGSISDPFNP